MLSSDTNKLLIIMTYYTNKSDIFEIEFDRKLKIQECLNQGKHTPIYDWIAYKVIRQLESSRCRLSQVHIPVRHHENVHKSLEEAKAHLSAKVDKAINKIKAL